ncbi:MAG: hypothetical protein JSU72_12325 [Deltaproteobacteria bacterium]|nr:MAG: hypothetical protein JSU72_12325 [Deltaproteobacteria bacterium]
MLPYRSTGSGMWAVSDAEEVYRVFCHFDWDRYTHMGDLGSGDGKVALIGSLFTRATGYETDDVLYRKSLEIRGELSLSNVSFEQQDYLLADLSTHDVLYLYPDKPFYALEERLHPNWKGHLLVHGPHFPPNHFRKITESPPSIGKFVLYESP